MSTFDVRAGVMAARGMLENPAMYAGYDVTPAECIRDWVSIFRKLIGLGHANDRINFLALLVQNNGNLVFSPIAD